MNALHRHTHLEEGVSTLRAGDSGSGKPSWMRWWLIFKAGKGISQADTPKNTTLGSEISNDAFGNHRKLTTVKMYGNKGKGIRQDKDRGITKGLVHQ